MERIERLLLNPFLYLDEVKLISLSLMTVSLLILGGYYTGTHFLGGFQVALSQGYDLGIFGLEVAIHLSTLFIPIYILSIIVSKRTPRLVDVMGAVLLSKVAFLIIIVLRFLSIFSSFATGSEFQLILRLIVWVCIIASLWWLYCGIDVATNLKWKKTLIILLPSILISEVCSRLIIQNIPQLKFIYYALL